ncbi:MAG: hypothetical protein OHK0047_27070 [Leptolyngbyaceae cyanobacterium]
MAGDEFGGMDMMDSCCARDSWIEGENALQKRALHWQIDPEIEVGRVGVGGDNERVNRLS